MRSPSGSSVYEIRIRPFSHARSMNVFDQVDSSKIWLRNTIVTLFILSRKSSPVNLRKEVISPSQALRIRAVRPDSLKVVISEESARERDTQPFGVRVVRGPVRCGW